MNNLTERIIKHSFFQGLRPEHLTIVSGSAQELSFKEGQYLFREHEPANQFYLIERGSVTLESHHSEAGHSAPHQVMAGEVLGWSWLFPPFLWHFDARALEGTHVIAISGARLLTAAEKDHDFGFELMKRVSQVLIHRLQTARKQFVDA